MIEKKHAHAPIQDEPKKQYMKINNKLGMKNNTSLLRLSPKKAASRSFALVLASPMYHLNCSNYIIGIDFKIKIGGRGPGKGKYMSFFPLWIQSK
jgi:hypothetical protein